jgi:hypothetical protein
MSDDPAVALVERLRRREFTDADLDAAIHTIRLQGVPASVLQGIRNEALKAYCAAKYPADTDARPKSRKVRTDLGRYAAAGWRRHQHEHVAPAEIAGTPTEHLWRALKHGAIKTGACGAEIISESQLRRVL